MSLLNKLSLGSFKKLFSISASGTARALGYNYAGADINTAYSKSAVAYSAIRRISQDISGSSLLFLSDPDNIESEVADTNPTKMMFQRPNPYLSQSQLLEYIILWLEYRGEFFVLFDNPERPTAMYPTADPNLFATLKGSKGELDGFKLLAGANTTSFLPQELIHHRFINPNDPYRGMSPLESAAHALNVDVQGDTLASDIVDHGGETSLVYETDEDLLTEQQDELQTHLKSRRTQDGKLPGDLLLTGGLKIADPKFTGFDYQIFDRMPIAEKKIAMVYGLSMSLLGHDDEPNYATFEGRMRIYWQQTLMPIIRGVESAFDVFFANLPEPVYVRWDRSKIAGLQADKKAQADTASVMISSGLPWAVVNEHLNMGLNVEDIPGSDEVLVPSTMAPLSQLIADWQYLPAENNVTIAASQRPGIPKGLTNKEIKRRATDPAAVIQRDRKLGRLERGVSRKWRSLNFQYRKRALKIWETAVKNNDTIDGMMTEFTTELEPVLIDDMADDAVADIQPRQISAAQIGQDSIEQLVTRDTEGFTTKVTPLSPETLLAIKSRENLIRNMTDQDLYQKIADDVYKTVTAEGELGEVRTTAQRSLDAQAEIKAGFNASANRAATIARTEVGTAFNVSRFNEMDTQGFAKHEWLAVGDSDTRETHLQAEAAGPIKVGDNFPGVNIAYPQDPSGPAEEVINCRCLTIPVIGD